MNKTDIVNSFLKRGYLLTPDALKKIEKNGIDKYLDKKFNKFIIDLPDLVFNSIKIDYNLDNLKTEFTKQDFIDAYKKRYEVLKSIFLEKKKGEYISFSNVNGYGVYKSIAIVKDIFSDEKKVIFEDATTMIEFVVEIGLDGLDIDDVVEIEYTVRGGKYFLKSFNFPDIPLRSPTKSDGKIAYIGELHLSEAPYSDIENVFSLVSNSDAKFVFIMSEIENKRIFVDLIDKYLSDIHVFHINSTGSLPSLPEEFDSNIISLSDPSFLSINDIKILNSSTANLDLLRKRYIKYDKIPHECFLINKVPDIVFYKSKEPFVMNHKSISFISSGDALNTLAPQLINLTTRDVISLK